MGGFLGRKKANVSLGDTRDIGVNFRTAKEARTFAAQARKSPKIQSVIGILKQKNVNIGFEGSSNIFQTRVRFRQGITDFRIDKPIKQTDLERIQFLKSKGLLRWVK